VTIPGLNNGEDSSVVLQAINIAGNSITSSPIIVNSYTIPSAPNVVGWEEHDSSVIINIHIDPGSDGGRAILNYQYALNGGPYMNVNSTDLSLFINSLTNGDVYTISLVAVNIAGNGPPVQIGPFVPYTVPNPPTNLKIFSEFNNNYSIDGSVIIQFDSPVFNGGRAITNYNYSTDGTTFVSFNPPTVSTTVTIPNLPYGVNRNVYLQAVNMAGNSVVSSSVIVNSYTYPSAPTIDKWTSFNGGASIYITPGFNGGRLISNYQYQYSVGINSGFTDYTDINSTISPLSISIPNNSDCTFRLRALTPFDASDTYLYGQYAYGYASTDIKINTKSPSPPSDITIIGEFNGTVYMEFTPGYDGGSTITNYQYSFGSSLGPYIPFSPAITYPPIIIKDLPYYDVSINIYLESINGVGPSVPSEEVPYNTSRSWHIVDPSLCIMYYTFDTIL
jgi:hypothetical protein